MTKINAPMIAVISIALKDGLDKEFKNNKFKFNLPCTHAEYHGWIGSCAVRIAPVLTQSYSLNNDDFSAISRIIKDLAAYLLPEMIPMGLGKTILVQPTDVVMILEDSGVITKELDSRKKKEESSDAPFFSDRRLNLMS